MHIKLNLWFSNDFLHIFSFAETNFVSLFLSVDVLNVSKVRAETNYLYMTFKHE